MRGPDPIIPVLTRHDLITQGMRPKQITRAVRSGRVLRIRRDRYMLTSNEGIERAVRVGGRLACVSLLVLFGVFVLDNSRLHLHLHHTMSRMRSPDDRLRPLDDERRAGLALHWWPLRNEIDALGHVGLLDAVAQAIRCQPARAAVATIDSVLHLGLLTRAEMADLVSWLPSRCQVLLRLADGTAESGTETLMRLILRQLSLRYEAQVDIPGVGRVDFVVEGRLIIECDSKAHHEGWAKQQADRRRDLAAAALGYMTLRPLASDLMYNSDVVIAAVRGLVRSKRR